MYRGGKNTSAPEIWAAGRRVERSQCDLRYGRDECNRVAGGLAGVVHAVPRAGTGAMYTKVTCECAIRWYSDPRGLFSHTSPPSLFLKFSFSPTQQLAPDQGKGISKTAMAPKPQ